MLFADSPSEFRCDERVLIAAQTMPTGDEADAAAEAPLGAGVRWPGEMAERAPGWCGGRERGVRAVPLRQFPCCGAVLSGICPWLLSVVTGLVRLECIIKGEQTLL